MINFLITPPAGTSPYLLLRGGFLRALIQLFIGKSHLTAATGKCLAKKESERSLHRNNNSCPEARVACEMRSYKMSMIGLPC